MAADSLQPPAAIRRACEHMAVSCSTEERPVGTQQVGSFGCIGLHLFGLSLARLRSSAIRFWRALLSLLSLPFLGLPFLIWTKMLRSPGLSTFPLKESGLAELGKPRLRVVARP